jgi:hypothetical protein
MIYVSIALNVTFLMIDVRNSIKRILKIIRYHKEMRRRRIAVAVHNFTVD